MADPNPTAPRPRLGFLFNHEALHQIAHSAPMIAELASAHPDFDISVLTSSPEQLAMVRHSIPDAVAANIDFIELRLSARDERINRVAGHFSPYKRIAILRSHVDLFSKFDALVVPEATSTMLKSRFNLAGVKLIYTHHGAGDRSVGFGEELKLFDLILVSGPKLRDRLRADGLVREGGYAVVGYPKFDALLSQPRVAGNFFRNERPTVLYNPHFEPRLSSWYTMGQRVLDVFAQSTDYNLIVAPHVMLFQRRVHASLEHFTVRLRRAIPERYLKLSHIRFDLGGESCVDMTYTLGADIYLGDASSQVYEFILNPRPCVFLNSHAAAWEKDPNYRHWSLGPVLDDPSQLPEALARSVREHDAYRPVQETLFAETIERSEVPSARRAAEAIARFLLPSQPRDAAGEESPAA